MDPALRRVFRGRRIGCVRRTFVLLVCTALAVTGVVAIQRLNQERHYRSLLADGDRALAAGHAYMAAEAYSGALAIRPDSMVAHYRRGEAYLAERQETQAARDLREARRLAPDAPEPLEALGRLYDARGDHVAAAGWYALATERLQDTDAALLHALALARYRTGDLPAARDAIDRAIARDASLPECHYLAGLIARDMHRPGDAVSALEHAVRLRPAFVAARQELASLHRAQGRPDAEVAQLRALVSLDEARVARHVSLALASLRAGRHDEALQSLSAAEAAAPGDSRVALAVGRVHLARAEATREPEAITDALAALERALGGTARRSEGLALYGRALHLSGDLGRAERLLQEATRTSPVTTEAFGYLADTAEAAGHPIVARDALLRLHALQGDTASPAARAARDERIGALSLEADDPRAAFEYLSRATRAGRAGATTLGRLARAQWETGRIAEARTTLLTALTLDPEDAELRRLARTIR